MMGRQRAEYLPLGRINPETCPVEMRPLQRLGQFERLGAKLRGLDHIDSAPRITAVRRADNRIQK